MHDHIAFDKIDRLFDKLTYIFLHNNNILKILFIVYILDFKYK